MKAISIVIVNYKSYQDTIDYVRNLLAQQKVNLNIVVVDNDSPNESLDQLTTAFNDQENVHVLDSGKNGGYSYGNNIGIKYVERNKLSEYVVISNNDVELKGDDFLYNFIEQYEKLPDNKAFISPLMYHESDLSRISARKLPTYTMELIRSSGVLSKIFIRNYDYNLTNGEAYIAVDCLPGSFFLGTVDLFKKINYFDEGLFLFGEEKIIAKKINERGLKNYIVCNMKFIHVSSKTINEEIQIGNKLRLRNMGKLYFWSNYSDISIIKYLFLKFFLRICFYENQLILLLRNKLKKEVNF